MITEEAPTYTATSEDGVVSFTVDDTGKLIDALTEDEAVPAEDPQPAAPAILEMYVLTYGTLFATFTKKSFNGQSMKSPDVTKAMETAAVMALNLVSRY